MAQTPPTVPAPDRLAVGDASTAHPRRGRGPPSSCSPSAALLRPRLAPDAAPPASVSRPRRPGAWARAVPRRHRLHREILTGSRIPRLAAGIAVGFALGVAGPCCSPWPATRWLARHARRHGGAYFAVTVVARLGLGAAVGLGAPRSSGPHAAAVVLALAGGAGTSTTRLILAGSAVALALQAGTSTLLILFERRPPASSPGGAGR